MKHACAAAALIVAFSASARAQQSGAATPREAVDKFVAAAAAQDVSAMGMVWGSASGPARDHMTREEIEQRELIMMRCLRHDSYKVVDERPSTNGLRVLSVELSRKDLTRPSNFTAARGPGDRWYVQSIDPNTLKDLCAQQ